jgi:hypothetical protein
MALRRDPDQSPDPSDIFSQPRPFPEKVAMNGEEGIPIHSWLREAYLSDGVAAICERTLGPDGSTGHTVTA